MRKEQLPAGLEAGEDPVHLLQPGSQSRVRGEGGNGARAACEELHVLLRILELILQ